MEIVSEPHKVRAAVDEFLRLHYARAIREDTVSHPNVFSTELSRAFLFDICERFARRDSLRIFQLKLRNEVVATRIGFACQDALYLYFSGYEPALAKYSVMTRVIAEAIQSAIREGFRTVNLSTGNDLSKLRWSPQETIYDEALLISRSRRSAIAYNAYQLAYRGLRKSLSTYPFSLTCR